MKYLPKSFFLAIVFLLLAIKPISAAYTGLANGGNDPDLNIRLRWKAEYDIQSFPAGTPNVIRDKPYSILNIYHFGSDAEIDPAAPQLSSVFSFNPDIPVLYQLSEYDGNTIITPNGLDNWGSTLMGATVPGGAVTVPTSGYEIGAGYQVTVDYLDAGQGDITINYTAGQSDPSTSPITSGYTIHFLGLKSINPELVSLYQQGLTEGKIIALPCGFQLGTGNEIYTSIRDSGTFFDARSGLDWWQTNAAPIACDLSKPAILIFPGTSPGGGAARPPISESYVPCPDVTDPEFHSKRPYPKSPCDQKVHEDVLYCANDLVAKQTFTLLPGQEQTAVKLVSCNPYPVPDPGPGVTVTCTYQINTLMSEAAGKVGPQVEISIPKAELPIVGDTELVPNSQTPANLLSDAARVNNYVSWFLNGTPFTAEDPPLMGKVKNYIDKLVTFAGPMRKLLPADLQNKNRDKQVGDATVVRHDQIVECLAGNIIACYQEISQERQRLSDKPQEKGGGALNLSQYVPLSSTEDRLGEAKIPSPQLLDDPSKPVQQQFGDILVDTNSLVFNPDSGISTQVNDPNNPAGNSITARNDLYFAHMQETTELANLLQKTFVPVDNDGFSGVTGEGDPYSSLSECKENTKNTGPGDKLYGDAHVTDLGYYTNIKGQIEYMTNTFPVDFHTIEKCSTDPDTGVQTCYWIWEAEQRAAYPALSVFTRTPKLNELWERLVDGDFSIFKKFFPVDLIGNKGGNSKDKPVYTGAIYKQASDARQANVDVLAGETGTTNTSPGNQAKLFIPHLQSVKDYFLQDLQCALRPQGMCGNQAAQQPPAGVCQINCDQSVPDSAIPSQYLGDVKSKFISLANRWAGTPGTPGAGTSYAEQCYNDVVKRSVAAGVNPAFALAEWVHESGASNYTAHNTSCITQDFGINGGGVPAADFNAQITFFLGNLDYRKESHYTDCFNNGYPAIQNWMQLYKNGKVVPCVPAADAISYLNEVISSAWNVFVPGSCSFPDYPFGYPRPANSCP